MLVVFEGLILSFWLLLICVVGIAKDGPVGLVVFYEQEVQDKVVELGLITKEKIKPILRKIRLQSTPRKSSSRYIVSQRP